MEMGDYKEAVPLDPMGEAIDRARRAEAAPAPNNPLVLLDKMIEKGIDAEQLGKMMDLHDRWQKNLAIVAYNGAMAQVQQKMPAIIRDKINAHTNSTYARYETLNALTKPIYTAEGFSLNWTEGPPKEGSKEVHMICDVRHADGHSVRHEGWFGLDDSGVKGTANKTAVQAKGSTYSYARRYLEKMIWNLAEADEDNDGNAQLDPALVKSFVRQTNEAIDDCRASGASVDFDKMLQWLEIKNLEELTPKKFAQVIDYLGSKRRNALKKTSGAKAPETKTGGKTETKAAGAPPAGKGDAYE